MIKSFGDRLTESLFGDRFAREFQAIARPAKRKLEMLDAASRLDDLLVPPSNRLEKLRGNSPIFSRSGSTIKWRVIFKWIDGHAHDVRIVDYH